MDMRLNASNAAQAVQAAARGVQRAAQLEAQSGAAQAGGAVQGGGFGQAFQTALQNVSAAQNRATQLQTEFQLGNPNVSLEQTMVAMQKAQIGFQAALHVRNRMMQAYTDVMNMQV